MPDRDAEFQLKATDQTGHATRSAADGMEKVSDKADKAQRSLDKVGDEAGHLSRKLLEARASALALAEAFDRTGDTKLLKDFEKVNREAAKLGRVMKSIKIDGPKGPESPDGILGGFVNLARKTGLIAGDAAVEGFGSAFKALGTAGPGGTAILAGLVAVGTAAAPIIAGSVAGAVLAGIATGGIGLGLVLAAKDPRVAAAYKALGQRLGTSLQADVKPFSDDLLGVAPKFEKAFADEEPRIKRIFAGLGNNLGPLVDNAISAVHKLMPSIERASAVGGMILRNLSAQLPALASDVGKLLDAFSSSGPGAAAALGLIIFQLRGLIALLAFGAQMSAPFLNAFGKLVELTGAVPDASGKVRQLSEVNKDAGASASYAAQSYRRMSDSMTNTATAANALNDAVSRLFGEQMGLDQANLAVKTGMANLTETIKGNKRSLDENTEAGRQNVGVILQQIGNIEAKRQAEIAAGNGTLEATQKANGAYVAQLENLRKLLYSLGLNKAEVDKLIDSYEELAKPQTKTFTTVFKEVGKIPPGYSDQSTGHSRTGNTDYGALDGWAPARFNAGHSREFAASGGGMYQPAVTVNSEHSFTVELDGRPFQARIVRTVDAAGARAAWRAKVGKR